MWGGGSAQRGRAVGPRGPWRSRDDEPAARPSKGSGRPRNWRPETTFSGYGSKGRWPARMGPDLRGFVPVEEAGRSANLSVTPGESLFPPAGVNAPR